MFQTLTRKTAGWVLTRIEQVPVYVQGGGAGRLTLTRRRYDEAAKRLLEGIEVAQDSAAQIAGVHKS